MHLSIICEKVANSVDCRNYKGKPDPNSDVLQSLFLQFQFDFLEDQSLKLGPEFDGLIESLLDTPKSLHTGLSLSLRRLRILLLIFLFRWLLHTHSLLLHVSSRRKLKGSLGWHSALLDQATT